MTMYCNGDDHIDNDDDDDNIETRLIKGLP